MDKKSAGSSIVLALNGHVFALICKQGLIVAPGSVVTKNNTFWAHGQPLLITSHRDKNKPGYRYKIGLLNGIVLF